MGTRAWAPRPSGDEEVLHGEENGERRGCLCSMPECSLVDDRRASRPRSEQPPPVAQEVLQRN